MLCAGVVCRVSDLKEMEKKQNIGMKIHKEAMARGELPHSNPKMATSKVYSRLEKMVSVLLTEV